MRVSGVSGTSGVSGMSGASFLFFLSTFYFLPSTFHFLLTSSLVLSLLPLVSPLPPLMHSFYAAGLILLTSQFNVCAATPESNPPEPPARKAPPRGKSGPGGGLIKPTMADTLKVNVYADNWFILYINGKLVAVDPIDFLPHNVVSVDILPEYPMTIAVMAKDNANAETGLEYGDHIGDAGFILKFSDGTVTDGTWKAKSFSRGPINRDIAHPRTENDPIPADWFAVNFDDRAWPKAAVYTEQRVSPKEPFYQADFKGAQFIWTTDLDIDNTVIFRTRIEKPNFKPRWTTKPEIDTRGAPLK